MKLRCLHSGIVLLSTVVVDSLAVLTVQGNINY